MQNLDDTLTPEARVYYLKEVLDYKVKNEIIYDLDGDEVLEETLTTLRQIIRRASQMAGQYGHARGKKEVQYLIKKALDIC